MIRKKLLFGERETINEVCNINVNMTISRGQAENTEMSLRRSNQWLKNLNPWSRLVPIKGRNMANQPLQSLT